MEIYLSAKENLKPSPTKVHYVFCWRDLFKVVSGIMLVESNYLKDQASLMKLFYHETIRVFGDKINIEEDKQWFYDKLKEICDKNFEWNPAS